MQLLWVSGQGRKYGFPMRAGKPAWRFVVRFWYYWHAWCCFKYSTKRDAKCSYPIIFVPNLEKSVSRSLLAGLFFLLTNLSFAQVISIVDKSTGEPVSEAIVYNEAQNRFAESNAEGLVNLNDFSMHERLFVQHPSFQTYSFVRQNLSDSYYTIQLQERVIRIDEVVISANKWEQNKTEIPFEIMTLGVEEMDFNNVQTAADALEATGQVFVQKSQLGGGSPMIRGFGANAVLIVVDGVRMNNAIFRGGNLQNIINIDPNALESSEVIFGPGAVIYGSDALGGVMDFHTVRPKYSREKNLKIGGHGMLRYSGANNEKTGSLQLRLANNRWSYIGNLSYSDFSDLRTGAVRPKQHPDFGKRPEYIANINGVDTVVPNGNENVQRFSGYLQLSTLQKISLRLKGKSELTYILNYSTTGNIPRYDRLTLYDEGQLKYAQWYYGPQRWMMNAVKFNYYQPNIIFDAAKVTLAYQIFEESRHNRQFQEVLLRNRAEQVGVLSFNADFEKDIDQDNHLYFGIEYLFNGINSTAFSEDIETGELNELSTRYPDGGSEVNSFAAYLSYKKDIGETLYFSAGLRMNYQDLYSAFLQSPFDKNSIINKSSAVNGNIGLVYRPAPSWIVSGVLSSGFRAPNVDDISKVFDSEPGSVVVPNPDLQPEYSYNTELSITKVWNDKLELNGNVFYSLLRDAMVRADFQVSGQDSIEYDGALSRVQAILNTGRANIYGFNFGVRAQISSRWSSSASFNVTEGWDLDNGEPLRHTTPAFGLASVTYSRRNWKGECFIRFNGSRTIENLPPSERNKPHIYSSDGSLAWYTLNIRGQYQISDWLSANIALENILDQHYRTYSSGISAPGRNLIFSVKVLL